MWIKLCLLLVYICLLFLLSRLLETISWCDLGSSGVLSRQLLDPMRLSVAKLKCLLDHRGVSYDGIVEKSELTGLVEASGPLNTDDVHVSCQEEPSHRETNFTSGAHFIEEVEDAKDSVWLVQVITHTEQAKVLINQRWRNVQRKASYFGVRSGLLDCSLDKRYCHHKGWKVPALLLALPSMFEKKASVIIYNYSGPGVESAIMNWIHDKLDSRIKRFKDVSQYQEDPSSNSLRPEIQAILFTQAVSAPLFFSALSVKFPGRIKFGLIHVDDSKAKKTSLKRIFKTYRSASLPLCIIYTTEGNYTYGLRSREGFSFTSMETFLKFLYPCLNDIFIMSFCVANVLSWFEFFVSNCGLFKRFRKFIWCVLKYNLMVITLWLPIIGLFQMPYLDRVPLLLLKLHRIFTISDVGAILRGDFVFFVNNPIYVYMSFILYLVVVTLLCKKYRDVEEDTDDWFNFRHMQTLTHLRTNNLFDPMRTTSYDLVGGLEVFGSRFTQHSLWLQPSVPLEYIQHLPTWRYTPQPLASRVAQNAVKIESTLATACASHLPLSTETKSKSECDKQECECSSVEEGCSSRAYKNETSAHTVSQSTLQGCDCSHGEKMSYPQSYTIARCKKHTQLNTVSSNCQTINEKHSANARSSFSPSPEDNGIDGSEMHTATNISRQSPAPCANTDVPARTPMQPDVLPNGFRKGFMESLQCVICLDEYVPHTMLCGLPCGHVFHETCIISWLNREKHFCPMCRWPSFKLMNTQSSS